MPSDVPSVQVRYSDPKITRILDALIRSGKAPSRSKLVEQLSVEPIMRAFCAWLAKSIQGGATYSELHAFTGLSVPDLMGLVEPELTLNDAEVTEHLRAISKRTGIDVEQLWIQAPEFKLGPE